MDLVLFICLKFGCSCILIVVCLCLYLSFGGNFLVVCIFIILVVSICLFYCGCLWILLR